MINLLKVMIFSLFLTGTAYAQPAGQLQAGQTWGNPSASKALAGPTTIGALLDQEYTCTARGSIMFRGSALWTCLGPGTSGLPLVSQGTGADLHYGAVIPSALPLATNAAIGGMRGDTTTINCTAGVCSAIGGVATAINVGSTTIGSGATLNLLYNNAGVLGNGTIASFLTAGTGVGITGTTNATISNSGVLSLGGANGTLTVTGPLQVTGSALSLNATTTAHGVPIFEGASAIANTGVGSTGQVLAGNTGADPSFKSGDWTLVQAINCAGQSNCASLAGVFNTYNEFEIVFENLSPTTSATSCLFEFTVSGTPVTIGYLATVMQFAATSVSVSTTTTSISCSNGSTLSNGSGINGWIRIGGGNPGNTNHHSINGSLSYFASTGNGQGLTLAGGLNTAAVIDGFIANNGSTWLIGQIKVYGRL